MAEYNYTEIEKKWQKYWLEHKTFKTENGGGKKKFYCLDMFPYPSGAGLHVGHPEGYTATDILCRYKRMKGFNVLHPMGWDAFGLPAEQYAVETGTHPAVTTKKNVDRFREQIRALGFSYDWDREVNTTDPKYYKWTQWIFEQLYKKGLAYVAEVPVNWCPALGTVLANEEVIDGRSERGNHPVIRRPMRQWMLKITAYAERLLAGLDTLDWPEGIKEMQRNWSGKSTGAMVDVGVCFGTTTGGSGAPEPLPKDVITVYTTRCDTLFGATYMVLSPEHALVAKWLAEDRIANADAVKAYQAKAASKSDLERTELNKEKTGVKLEGVLGVNPVNGEALPIFISDYVLATYGTGAIMAVPAHDERDFDFAKVFGLPIYQVVAPAGESGKSGESGNSGNSGLDRVPYTADAAFTDIATGVMVNSGFLNGLSVEEARVKMIDWLVEKGVGKAQTQYKLRDWLFSRQRYWGEPFPVIHWEDGTQGLVDENDLPLTLPELADYKPTGTGEPPLAKASEWVNVVDPATGKKGTRETNTMPQWAGSCWYYLRYIDPHNDKAFVDPAKEKYWMPVDLYVGGAEHAVLHLLYARFWHKVLFDLGLVSTNEPFHKLVNQGMILGELEYTLFRDPDSAEPVSYLSDRWQARPADEWKTERLPETDVEKRGDRFVWRSHPEVVLRAKAEKMSKSRGNVINPDDIVREHGADALRLYEMFMGPLTQVKPWSMKGVEGVSRFLNRVYRLVVDDETGELSPALADAAPTDAQLRALHAVVKKVTTGIEKMEYNTAISAMMIFLNDATAWEQRPRAVLAPFVQILAPFAPHIAEELWSRLGHSDSLAYEPWPTWDEEVLKEKELELPVQVNGKLRGRITVPADAAQPDILAAAKACPTVVPFLAGKTIRKEIVVPARMVNLVVG